ncbi:hybrid sensor histidine kinase/response regulator [Polyangium jinanense]|uniref:histidine kinase n=1 Tax=Polyangium jinanense TaxID=2829994 RepID=A0A9X3X2E8_9BACT|nr:response regulator [Polyangium jinanense]MDC3955249.1 response regulator [Polyangium jinanense]MDC3981550.1 response regulator [Polyangium jinanense]
MSQSDNDDIWALFCDEATEALEDLARVVERFAASETLGDAWALERALRILHNIKGAARVAGSEGVEVVAHGLEEALGAYRREGAPIADVIMRLRDGIGLISRFVGGDAPLEAARDFAASLEPETSASSERTTSANPAPAGDTLPAAKPGAPSSVASATTVRVEASRLDDLMQFAEEFLVAQGRRHVRHAELEQCLLELSQIERAASGELRATLGEVTRRLDALVEANRQDVQRSGHLVRDWSAAVKRARMLPLAGAVPQWRRTVAETAHALGREARLVADVGDIEVDRQILDGLRDPMLHLLRNAVDHGIEPPEVRERQGRPRMGTIRVRARAPGMMVELEVSDDGRGMDATEIGRRAVERGILSPERLARMNAVETAEIVFFAGFSTAASVSHVSGRGMGLDIVKQRLSELGGHVRIAEPTMGGGTFRMEVPATVVSTKALLVRTARSAYALPTAYVARAFRVASSEVQVVDGVAAVPDAEGEPLRLRWLSALMQEPRQTDPEKLLVIALSDGATRIGVVVDEVVGEVESVAKGLPWNLPRIPGIAGAMILGSGVLAVVLDVPRLLDVARGRQGERTETVHAAEAMKKRRILVVDDSLTSRTLERNILAAAGYDVDTANDGEAGWQALQGGTYDLVVSDVQMPRLNGVELTQRIRAHPKFKSLPVILVTSLDRPTDLAQGSAAGADEYIVKGRFDQRKLLEAVARLI